MALIALPLSLKISIAPVFENSCPHTMEGHREIKKTFRLVDKVSVKWRDLGLQLSIEPAILDGWEVQYQRDAKKCWNEVMGELI